MYARKAPLKFFIFFQGLFCQLRSGDTKEVLFPLIKVGTPFTRSGFTACIFYLFFYVCETRLPFSLLFKCVCVLPFNGGFLIGKLYLISDFYLL